MAIAFFHTWTTYGTWLPGDERGWYDSARGLQLPDTNRSFESQLLMHETAVLLTAEQRAIVEATIRDHCNIRNWELHAVNCRSNHVHAVVTAAGYTLKVPRIQLKGWTTQKLKLTEPARLHWWTEKGWDVYIDTNRELSDVIDYVDNQ